MSLPVVLPPLAGEAWVAWLFRMASAYQCTPYQMAADVRIFPERRWPAHCGNHLDADELARLSELLNIDRAVIRDMQLDAYHGGALLTHDHNGALPRVAAIRTGWALWSGARICPGCLGRPEPIVRNRDRLGFAVICPAHQVTLLDRCPACGQRPLAGAVSSSVPSGAHARVNLRYCHGKIKSRSGRTTLCGHDLSTVTTPTADGQARGADDLLRHLLTGQPLLQATARDALDAWRSFTALLLKPEKGRRAWLPTPDITHEAVQAVVAAAQVLRSSDDDDAARCLRRLAKARGIALDFTTRDRLGRSELAARLVALARQQTRTRTSLRPAPRPPTQVSEDDILRARANGLSLKQIAQDCAAPRSRVRAVVTAAEGQLAIGRRRTPTPDPAWLAAQYANGATHRDLAAQMGISPTLTLARLAEAGIERRARGSRWPALNGGGFNESAPPVHEASPHSKEAAGSHS